MTATIQLTFDGSLVRNRHQVAMRDLAQAMIGVQAAADRACLDVLHGDVWKHQRLPRDQYDFVEFVVGEIREGSFVIDFLSDSAAPIIRRIIKAIANPYEKAIAEGGEVVYSLGQQIESRRDIARVADRVVTYENIDTSAMPLVKRTYGDRSINKEIAQMLNPVSREPGGLMRIVLKESEDDPAQTFEFDNESAKTFKKIVNQRELGAPVLYTGLIRELDRGSSAQSNFKGKFINASNKKTIILHIAHKNDFAQLVPYLNSDEPFQIIAAPVIEFSSFDPVGGDIQFLEIYHE